MVSCDVGEVEGKVSWNTPKIGSLAVGCECVCVICGRVQQLPVEDTRPTIELEPRTLGMDFVNHNY